MEIFMEKFKEWAPKVLGNKKTEKIVRLAELREKTIKSYDEMYDRMRELNENMRKIDPKIQDWYGNNSYRGMRTPEEMREDTDECVLEKVCQIAAGKFWDNRNYGAERWTASIRKQFSGKNATGGEIDEMCYVIALTKRAAVVECATRISWRMNKDRSWIEDTERLRTFEFKSKQKIHGDATAQVSVAETILGIAQYTSGADIPAIEEMIEEVKYPEAGKIQEWKGIMKMKSFKETCDITILMPGLTEKINEFVKEGLKKRIEENERINEERMRA